MDHSWLPKIDTFLCKIASRCNLDCDYCYMYNGADQSWKTQPIFMSDETIGIFAEKLGAYLNEVKIPVVRVVLHGGEPLLAGKEKIGRFVEAIQMAVGRTESKVEFRLQTNGTLLDEDRIQFLYENNIPYGISFDGGRRENDRHRLDHRGNSSFERTYQAAKLSVSSYYGKKLFRGIIAVVDLRNDPVETYNFFSTLRPPKLSFNLPHGTHDAPPVGKDLEAGTRPYADWFIRLFDHWFSVAEPISISVFENLIESLLGGRSIQGDLSEGFGNLITIETNGEIQDIDNLKWFNTAGPTLIETGNETPNIHSHDILDVLSKKGVAEHLERHSLRGLPDVCQNCEIKRVCGGGFVGHRFSKIRGFNNPSVYCEDIKALVEHIRRAVFSDMEVEGSDAPLERPIS